jgi:hypothetical protein
VGSTVITNQESRHFRNVNVKYDSIDVNGTFANWFKRLLIIRVHALYVRLPVKNIFRSRSRNKMSDSEFGMPNVQSDSDGTNI